MTGSASTRLTEHGTWNGVGWLGSALRIARVFQSGIISFSAFWFTAQQHRHTLLKIKEMEGKAVKLLQRNRCELRVVMARRAALPSVNTPAE